MGDRKNSISNTAAECSQSVLGLLCVMAVVPLGTVELHYFYLFLMCTNMHIDTAKKRKEKKTQQFAVLLR